MNTDDVLEKPTFLGSDVLRTHGLIRELKASNSNMRRYRSASKGSLFFGTRYYTGCPEKMSPYTNHSCALLYLWEVLIIVQIINRDDRSKQNDFTNKWFSAYVT